MLDYSVAKNGIEPKLKLGIDPVKGVTGDDFSLDVFVERIILGPTISNPLAVASVQRMLQRLGRYRLSERLTVCTTPYRRR
jgi:hypothetical protein